MTFLTHVRFCRCRRLYKCWKLNVCKNSCNLDGTADSYFWWRTCEKRVMHMRFSVWFGSRIVWWNTCGTTREIMGHDQRILLETSRTLWNSELLLVICILYSYFHAYLYKNLLLASHFLISGLMEIINLST